MPIDPTIITRGFGNGTFLGDIPDIITRGYAIHAGALQSVFYNRVLVDTLTVGMGDVFLGDAVATSNSPGSYLSFTDVGVPDLTRVTILITDQFVNGIPRDFELTQGTYYTSGPMITRDTVLVSKINGAVSSIDKMALSGHAQVSIVIAAEDLPTLGVDPTAMVTAVSPFDNFAGASAGTLTNAPAIGDPTKWIAINDAGTTRYIPAW